ncbi:MAG: RNA polymerase II transcription factor B subunit 1 [Icmadophila ericetorum]|nr:RNA polymerase II transcription factor B subunit 1 [Icmadophila ericetorum]
MAPPRGFAAYKKKDGTLAVSTNGQSVLWTPTAPPGSKPAVTLAVSTITNLQQTPASSAKVMLKIFAQPPGAEAIDTHVFTFTSAQNARSEADAIKVVLTEAIQASKTGGAIPAAPSGGDGKSTSAAMAIARAVSSVPGAGRDADSWYDDSKLKGDVALQQSLLKANLTLSKTFMESLRTKPDSISNSQFTSQFWSSRVHLLRAHAIEKNQTRGAYNVLSTIKPKTIDNVLRLSVSKEQIQLIFNQYPLVKRVYDENVPNLSEDVFWSRFFQSRLFKKLKGERISDADPTDPTLDKYLQYDDDAERAQRLLASHVPHIIDMEGNEANNSQRKGNQPDLTMRPTSVEKVPIIRTLNSLSEKIMSHVRPSDVDPSQPIGMDEETFNSLALRDLQGAAEESRIILNIKDQSRFFSTTDQDSVSADALLYAKKEPQQVLQLLRVDLATLGSDIDLETAIGVKEDSDSEDDEPNKKGHVGSKASLRAATAQMFAAISGQRVQNDDLAPSSSSSSTFDLSPSIYDRLQLVHATTTEFLSHFWGAFLSGDPSRADECEKLVETLDRAMDRMKVVADDAEAERMKEVGRLKQHVLDHYARTKKKLKFDPESVKGGAKAVMQLLGPTIEAVGVASGKYREALSLEDVVMDGA